MVKFLWQCDGDGLFSDVMCFGQTLPSLLMWLFGLNHRWRMTMYFNVIIFTIFGVFAWVFFGLLWFFMVFNWFSQCSHRFSYYKFFIVADVFFRFFDHHMFSMYHLSLTKMEKRSWQLNSLQVVLGRWVFVLLSPRSCHVMRCPVLWTRCLSCAKGMYWQERLEVLQALYNKLDKKIVSF